MDGEFSDAWKLGRHNDVEGSTRWDERHLARMAAAQDGVVQIEQLKALGLSREARRRRIEQKRLIVQYPGVYAVGHDDLSERGRFRAAVWAAGDGALLRHLAAARLLGIWERPVRPPSVTVPKHRRAQLPGVPVRRHTHADATHVRGIPCTSVSQTLVDLAPTPMLEAAFELAERRGLIRPKELERLVYRRPGAANLRALLATHRPKSGPTRSVLERRLLSGLRRAGLPEPIVNGKLDLDGLTIEPDLMWPQQRVLVELDGLDTHGTRTAMRRDRRRDRAAIRAGWTPLRFTWHDVDEDVAAVVSDIDATVAG